MDQDVDLIKRVYACFNQRDIDGVLAALTGDVAWANGMEGGHVHGPEALRAYWTRQWGMVDPHVEPVGFHRDADGAVVAEVVQTIRDLDGNPLQDPAEGPVQGPEQRLKDKTLKHVFRFRDGKVERFDVEDLA